MNNIEAKFNPPNLPKTSCFPQADDHHHHASNADSNHQSAQLIGWNDDLLNKILSSLPAKSILRFKAVSKQWLSLLTHPRFTLQFDKLSISSGLYYHELPVPFDGENPTLPPFRSPDFSPDKDGIRIVQSCNGLLLCCCHKDRRDNYYVFNPTTKKFVAIRPVIGGPHAKDLIRFMGLAFHPTECVHYKLVCILRAGHTYPGRQGFDHGNRMYNIQIYSSHTGKWKKLNQTFTPLWYTEFRYGVYWNGAFHWAPSCPNPMYLRLDTEQIQELPLPSPFPVRVTSPRGYYSWSTIPLYFGESGGHLHLVDASHEKNPLNMNVYEMLRDHSGWFIKYQVDLHELSVTYPNMTHNKWPMDKYEFRVLDVVRGEEEGDTFMVVKVVDNIKRYNILDKSFRQLFYIPNNIEDVDGCFSKSFGKTFHPFVAHRYMEKIGSF